MSSSKKTQKQAAANNQVRSDKILTPFLISDDLVQKVRKIFECEIKLGLASDSNDKSSLMMQNTFLTELCTGKEKGTYLALELGGTNFRVISWDFQPGKVPQESSKFYTIPEVHRTGCGNDLFDFIGSRVCDFFNSTEKLHKNSKRKLLMGLCFSFPMIQKSPNSAALVTWTKNFDCPDVVGKDVSSMIRCSIRNACKNIPIDVVCTINDCTATIVNGSYMDQKTAIGLILGTGFDICYLEKIECIQKWKGDHEGVKEVAVDIGCCNFGDNGVLDFLKTPFDKRVNELSLSVNKNTFEKFFSGKYLGEIVRLVILKMIKNSILFDGHVSHEITVQYNFSSSDILSIINANEEILDITKEIFSRLGIAKVTLEDASIIRKICTVVLTRGALLVSICVASLLDRMEKENVSIAVDGYLYRRNPLFQELMPVFVKELAPRKNFQFILVEDSNGRGAGLSAAIIDRLKSSTHFTEICERHS